MKVLRLSDFLEILAPTPASTFGAPVPLNVVAKAAHDSYVEATNRANARLAALHAEAERIHADNSAQFDAHIALIRAAHPEIGAGHFKITCDCKDGVHDPAYQIELPNVGDPAETPKQPPWAKEMADAMRIGAAPHQGETH